MNSHKLHSFTQGRFNLKTDNQINNEYQIQNREYETTSKYRYLNLRLFVFQESIKFQINFK